MIIKKNKLKEDNPGQHKLTRNLLLYVPFILTAAVFIFCLVMELMEIDISDESRLKFYNIFGNVSFYTCIILTVFHCRNYKLGWIRSLIFSVLTFLIIHSCISQIWAAIDIKIFGGGAIAAYRSAMFFPLLCFVFSKFCKVDTLNLCDCLAPYFFFNHGVVTISCWILGCCAGKTMQWGIVNPVSGLRVFPLQPCIIILSVVVAFWGLYYSKKCEYRANGVVFANSLIIYGTFRYLIELFSDDARVFWVLSWLSVCSLAMIVQGFIVRYIVRKKYKTP